MWVGSREEDFLPTLLLKQLFLSPKTPVSPAPSWFLPAEKPKYARVTARPSSSCNSADDSDAFPSPQAFPSVSSYPLCQELILSPCSASPVNDPFPPTSLTEQRRAPVMCWPWHSFRVFHLLRPSVLFFYPSQDLQAEVMEGQS